MLQSSLGFHTMTLSFTMIKNDVRKLIMDFGKHNENTETLKIYRKKYIKWKSTYVLYRPTKDRISHLPEEIKVYYSDGNYKGIEWRIKYSGKPNNFSEYVVEALINPKILAGINDYLTAATYDDMDTVIANFNYESNVISPLLKTFDDYKISRIDYCANICLNDFIPVCDPELVMNLIKRSDIPYPYKEWMEYDNIAHRKISRPESFYLTSKSVNINCYSKYMQLKNRSREYEEKGYAPISTATLDAAKPIIRFEVQCKYFKTYFFTMMAEKSGKHEHNKYKTLLSPSQCFKVVSDYYSKVIGKGDWYTLQEATRLVQSQNFNSQKEKRLTDALSEVSKCRSLAKAKASYQGNELTAFKKTLNELAALGINPVTIPREWNIKHIPNFLYAYFDKIKSW